MATLQQAINAALPRLRREAEERMTSDCIIERVVGVVTSDDGVVSEEVETVWCGPCRTRGRGEWAMARGSGSSQTIHATEIHIPVDIMGIEAGDRVTIRLSPEPRLRGNVYRVIRVHEASQTTAQRLGVEAWARTLAN